ncbi:DNA polymerase III subunit alpha, partial [Leptospira interrogans serovar Pomona]|uniref:OB-fold nucleic acid binding domain-containing protein n=1 Tax=Leptospira interrogans TaxID=173 RepID=UPI001A0DA22A
LNLPKDALEWEIDEKLRREKAIAGLYLSGHPLDKSEKQLKSLRTIPIEKFDNLKSGSKVEVAGIISSKNIKLSKRNEEFANFKLEDRTGEIECVAFAKTYQKYKEFIKEDQAIFIKGDLDKIE